MAENNLTKNLETTGLTQKESAVYLALLETGQASIAGLAQKTGIKRPTCYLIIDELIKKGLATSVPVGRKTLYVPGHTIVKFEISLTDRAGHKSNVVTSNEITLP